MKFFEGIIELLTNDKYMGMLFEGLGLTILISIFAALIGLILGTIVAMVGISKSNKFTIVPKAICKAYVTIIRGTPMALQLFIMAYVIFAIKGFPREIKANVRKLIESDKELSAKLETLVREKVASLTPVHTLPRI